MEQEEDFFPIQDLPELVILKIFEFLPLLDQKNASLVCKDWLTKLQVPRFLNKLTWKFERCSIKKNHPPWSDLENSKKKITHMTFGDGVTIDDAEDGLIFCRTIGRHIKSVSFLVEFEKNPHNWDFIRMLYVFPKLQEIHQIEYRHLILFDVPKSVKKVHCSRLYSTAPTDEVDKLRKLSNLTTNLVVLNKLRSSKTPMKPLIKFSKKFEGFLQNKALDTEFLFINPLVNVSATELDFRHIFHLEKNTIEGIRKWLPWLNECINLKSISLQVIHNNKGCFFLHKIMNKLDKVEKVSVKLNQPKDSCEQCWKNLIKCFPNTQCWNLPSNPFIKSTSKPVKELQLELSDMFKSHQWKLGNLEKLTLKCVTNFRCNLDTSILPKMVYLKEINLNTGISLNTEELFVLISKTPNVTKATFMNCKVTSEDLRKIGKMWPYLKDLDIMLEESCQKREFLDSMQDNFGQLRLANRSDRERADQPSARGSRNRSDHAAGAASNSNNNNNNGGAGAVAGGGNGAEWNNEETDRFSFEDSDHFEEDSLCSWSSEPESVCNNWRGWKKPTIGNCSQTRKSEQVTALTELAARCVATYIPFELVEHVYPPVPEQLQLRIAFWSFPDNEEDIRLYSCLANSSPDEFHRGEQLFKNKCVKDPLQIGFHLSASVVIGQPKNQFNVSVTFDRRKISSCNCTCSSAAYWCSHVVAVCLYRIHCSTKVNLRAPVSESLIRLEREQLQKFAQYLISELPQQILPTAQRLLDELLSAKPTTINTVCGAPDPTAGASINDQTNWYLDEKTLHDNIKKILTKFCQPTPMVFSDVNYLTNSAPPAAAEWSSLLRPLRGREPEGMWNLLSIVREMYRRCDRNAIRLLEVITEECLACDQVLVWWFNIKLSMLVGCGSHSGGKHGSPHSNSNAMQHACASLCDEIVVLWRLAALNPELAPDERDMLHAQFTSWHLKILDRVTKCYVQSSSHSSKQQQNLRNDAELFTGFKPAIEACYLDWEDYPIAGITHTVDTNPMYHCPFTCFKHTDPKTEMSSKINTSQAILTNDPLHYTSNSSTTMHHHNVRQKREKNYRERQQSSHQSASSNNHQASTSSASVLLEERAPGNRSSVSSEGFCENEDDSSPITQSNSISVVTVEAHEHNNLQHSCSSTSNNSNNGSSVSNNNVNNSSTTKTETNVVNKSINSNNINEVSNSIKLVSSKTNNLNNSQVDDETLCDIECEGAVGGEPALDSSISSSSLSSSSSQSNDSNSFKATFEPVDAKVDASSTNNISNDQNQQKLVDHHNHHIEPKPGTSKEGGTSDRRPSKDESFSSSESHQDDYSGYYYEKVAPEEEIKSVKPEPAKFPVFSNIRPTEDAWDIQFSRAEGLHAHGHDREASLLGVRLAEELLANPPNLMIEVTPPVKRKGKKHNINPIFHQISVLASATLAKCAFLCTVLSENGENYDLAFKVCLFGLEMPRPPASTKPLEVKLNNQESDLLALLKKIPLTANEMQIIREKAEQLRDGTLKSRGPALLPIMLASFIFDALVVPTGGAKDHRPKVPDSARLPTDEQLGFEAAVVALGLKANVAEAEHPLLCEGTRRQRGDLALTLLYHYKDEPRNICKIMEKLLDREIHTLLKTPLIPSYYSNNPPYRTASSQQRMEEERERELMEMNVASRPQSSTSAELETNMSMMTINVFSSKPGTQPHMNPPVMQTRPKEGRYKGRKTYPSIPNQPSEAGAHFIFELAKNVLTKAGGTSSTSLFTHVANNNNHHGPHRALHMCAFQLGLYALGLHNCVSPNWLSRTYSSHVSWIVGQAMEIGPPAISFLIDTWEGHLTPPEAANMADKASSKGWESNMVYPAAELALSVLPHAAALNPSEIQRAISQCREQNDKMLERACYTVEQAAKGGGVYPEVLFQVARHWYELYLKHTPNGELEPEDQNEYFSVNLMPLIESGDAPQNATASNAPIPPVVVAANPPPTNYQAQAMNPVSRIGIQPFVPYNYPMQGIYPTNIPFHPNQMPVYISQPQFQYGPQQVPKAPPMFNNSPNYQPMSLPNAPVVPGNPQPFPTMPSGQQFNPHQAGPAPPMQPNFYPNMPPQPQVVPQPIRQGGVQQHFNYPAPTPAGVGPQQQQQQQQQPPPPNAGTPRQRHPHQFSSIQMKYLLAAYNVGMLALETLARRVHDDRPQAKYARNPPYGDDIKWLLRISKRLGTQHLHQFCVCVVQSIVSPFILHEVAIEAAHYLARNNPALVLQHLRNALCPLVTKAQQMYFQSLHQKLYHLTVADYEAFVSTILSARNAFQISPDGPQQFKDWLQTIRRSKSCKKELWTQINNALQNGSK